MSTMKDSLSDLARHVQLLEASVAKLTQALGHWRLLEAEYEALREEVAEAAESDESLAQQQHTALVRIRRDFDGQLVDQQTISEIFGARPGQNITKTPAQIGGVIGRRLDYVRQNAATLETQVAREANRLAAAQVISQPDMLSDDAAGDDGPIMDIVEELDEAGNVVNVRIQTPSNTQEHVLDALKRAGIDELPAGPEETETEETKEIQETKRETTVQPATQTTAQPKEKKSVSFAEDPQPDSTATPQKSRAVQRLDEIMRTAKEQETMLASSTSVAPLDESEEDAALRREMLAYSMSEIGPIVAQLDIEEGSSDGEEFDEGYDDEFDDDDDEDEDEDEEDSHGRSKHTLIDEAYRERMRELERKLGVAKAGEDEDEDEDEDEADGLSEGIGRIRVSGVNAAPLPAAQAAPAPTSAPPSSMRDKAKDRGEKKKVSFSSVLDISPDVVPPPVVTSQKTTPKIASAEPLVEPLSDVIERDRSSSSSQAAAVAPAPTAKKPSRFRMARGGALPKGPDQAPIRFLDSAVEPGPTPEGPAGQTVANTIVERVSTTPDGATAPPREPDALDPSLLLREATEGYHRARNRLIQQQGGFLRANESGVIPLDEEGEPKRVSKFKAARLARQ